MIIVSSAGRPPGLIQIPSAEMKRLIGGLLRLMRPANLPTAAADIVAGMAIAGLCLLPLTKCLFPPFSLYNIGMLLLSSILLYAGGVVMNDVFDLKVDRIERPERPIPSGVVKVELASVFGVSLLIAGVICAFGVNKLSGLLALALLGSILMYDAFSKRYAFLGPLNMGLCRGLNLLLGMSVIGELTGVYYGLIPLVYIFAITLISRGEVHGNNRKHIIWAGVLYALVILSVLFLVVEQGGGIVALLFSALFALMIYRPLYQAYRENTAGNIRKAVMAGVISLILLDAALAVAFSQVWLGLLVLLLWPLSRVMSKAFAVT